MVGHVLHPIPVRIQPNARPPDEDCQRSIPVRPVACLPARILASSSAKISALSVGRIQSIADRQDGRQLVATLERQANLFDGVICKSGWLGMLAHSGLR